MNSSANSTDSSPALHDLFSPLSSPALLEDLKSVVLNQINLNKQIQQVLLSSHQSGNFLDVADNVTDPRLYVGNFLSIDFYPSFNKMPLSTQSVFTFILKVEAMLDKTICALSTVFIGSSGSTFTEDILRLRKDWGLASPCDEYLCRGEVPNFIADDE
ncbi:unnamed protein product [Ilex paraguariensis]|uniref:Uncharacterized protein n=1 Tax=Ilex paraguariensis TaxID=185542 RepID=A0ABC8T3R1_9AQUA